MADAAALPVDVGDLINQVQAAIDLGDMTAQNAPGGHPIFGAVDQGREVLAWLQENRNLLASGVGANVLAQAQGAIDAIYAAAADVKTDPGAPLPATIFPTPSTPIPWTLIAGGAAAIALVALLFRKKGRGKR